jgi:hypothetical protein
LRSKLIADSAGGVVVTNLNDPSTSDVIAALTKAMAKAASPGEGHPPLLMRDLHVSFVSAPNVVGAATSTAARLLQRGGRSAHVEAQLKTPQGGLIAFAVGRLVEPDPFAAPPAAVAPATGKRGVLRTIWKVLEAMSG